MRVRRRSTANAPPPMRVPCFVYCAYMHPEALERLGVVPPPLQPARLRDWRVTFTPRPDLTPAPGACVDGLLTFLTHTELDKLYGPGSAMASYRPLPVQVDTAEQATVAIAFATGGAPTAPDPVELDAYLDVCWRMGLPAEHCQRLAEEARRIEGAIVA